MQKEKSCQNCGNKTFLPNGNCMQCGRGTRIGPGLYESIIPCTSEDRAAKRAKAHGTLLSPEEAAAVRKRLGLN